MKKQLWTKKFEHKKLTEKPNKYYFTNIFGELNFLYEIFYEICNNNCSEMLNFSRFSIHPHNLHNKSWKSQKIGKKKFRSIKFSINFLKKREIYNMKFVTIISLKCWIFYFNDSFVWLTYILFGWRSSLLACLKFCCNFLGSWIHRFLCLCKNFIVKIFFTNYEL